MVKPRYYHDSEGNLTALYYRLTVRGQTHHFTYHVPKGYSEKTARKEGDKAAVLREAELKKEKDDGDMTFEELFKEYLENSELKHSTTSNYLYLSKRVLPVLGGKKIRDITPNVITAFRDTLQQNGRIAQPTAKKSCDFSAILQKKAMSKTDLANKAGVHINTVKAALNGTAVSLKTANKIAQALDTETSKIFAVVSNANALSPKTVIEHVKMISSVFKYAVEMEYLDKSPVHKRHYPRYRQKPVECMKKDELETFVEALNQFATLKWRTMMLTYLATGTRRGELVGLRWSEVDLDNQQITITRTANYRREYGVYEDTPKTYTTRYASIPRELAELLKELLAEQKKKQESNPSWNQMGSVFPSEKGVQMHPDSVTKWLDRFCEQHGLEHIHPHITRHTHASFLIANKADIVSVSKRMGHTRVSTTLNIYSHQIAEIDKANGDLMGKILFSGSSDTAGNKTEPSVQTEENGG